MHPCDVVRAVQLEEVEQLSSVPSSYANSPIATPGSTPVRAHITSPHSTAGIAGTPFSPGDHANGGYQHATASSPYAYGGYSPSPLTSPSAVATGQEAAPASLSGGVVPSSPTARPPAKPALMPGRPVPYTQPSRLGAAAGAAAASGVGGESPDADVSQHVFIDLACGCMKACGLLRKLVWMEHNGTCLSVGMQSTSQCQFGQVCKCYDYLNHNAYKSRTDDACGQA